MMTNCAALVHYRALGKIKVAVLTANDIRLKAIKKYATRAYG